MNRMLYAEDCLDVLTDPVAVPPTSVDPICLDPPFNSKGKDKSARPVSVLADTWRWNVAQDVAYERLKGGPATLPVAQLIDVARRLEGPTTQYRLDACLVNMAVRLIAMRNVPDCSIDLHCDPTASHCLKALMELIFGKDNFRNDIVWSYGWGGIVPVFAHIRPVP